MSRAIRDPIRLTLYSDAVTYGGAEKYLWLLARHLDPARYQVSAVVPPDAGAARLEGELRSIGVRVFRFPRPGFRWWRHLPGMIRLFRGIGGEVLHLNLPSTYDAGVSSVAWAARQAGYRRVISTEHLPMIDRKYRKFPVKLFFTHWIDRVIAIAESNREPLVRRHGVDAEKIRSLPNGVEPADALPPARRDALREEWGIPEGGLVAGIVASLSCRKGHPILLEALGLLEEDPTLPELRVVAIGEGEEGPALRRRAEELGVADHVRWLGSREDAAALIGAFDLFVLPSSMETMPLTILEAMAAGVPVVSTRIYGVVELVDAGETGLLVEAGDAGELAGAIRLLALDSPLRRQMGENGRARFEARFTARRMTERTARIYEDLEESEAALEGPPAHAVTRAEQPRGLPGGVGLAGTTRLHGGAGLPASGSRIPMTSGGS